MSDDTTSTMPTSASSGEGHGNKWELVVATLLGIAAVLTAWASLQGTLLGGDSQKAFANATLATDEAGQWYNEGTQQLVQDGALWLEYAKAAQAENEELGTYLKESLMSDNLAKAVDWVEKRPEEDIDSPFYEMEKGDKGPPNPYKVEAYDEAEALEAKAEKKRALGEKYDNWGDSFDGVTVLLAISLFMFGISTLLGSRMARFGTMLLGLAMLGISAVKLVDLGVYQWGVF